MPRRKSDPLDLKRPPERFTVTADRDTMERLKKAWDEARESDPGTQGFGSWCASMALAGVELSGQTTQGDQTASGTVEHTLSPETVRMLAEALGPSLNNTLRKSSFAAIGGIASRSSDEVAKAMDTLLAGLSGLARGIGDRVSERVIGQMGGTLARIEDTCDALGALAEPVETPPSHGRKH